METLWGGALWRQYRTAIDELDRAIAACPDSLWTTRVWTTPPPEYFPAQFGEFWYVAYHAVVWLDIYGSGLPEEEFQPPPPFKPGELDSHDALPDHPYSKEAIREYLASTSLKVQELVTGLTEESASRSITYPWCSDTGIGYFELQLYAMLHVQEHAAQLSLFLGEHASQ